jgi:hypothetical protein
MVLKRDHVPNQKIDNRTLQDFDGNSSEKLEKFKNDVNLMVELEKHMNALKSQVLDLTNLAQLYQETGRDACELLLKFGNHTPECDTWELRASGRLVEIPEEEICTCEWVKTKNVVSAAKERGLTGQITPEEVKLLVDHYKK